MVNPVFILVAKLSSQDKDSGALSIFEIVEKLQFTAIPKPIDPAQPIMVLFEPMRLIATWSSETDADRNREYDYEIEAFMPDESLPLIAASGTFRFEAGKQNHRITVIFASPLPITKPGIIRFQGKIRVTGTPNWQTQSYLIPVEALLITPDSVSQSNPSS